MYRCNYPLLRSGVTITACITQGHIIVYGSLSVPNPNSAHNDFRINIMSENSSQAEECESIFVPNPDFLCINTLSNDQKTSRKRSVPTHQDQSPHSSGVVYLSFIGKDKVNHFVVNSSGGNNVEKSHKTPTHSPEPESQQKNHTPNSEPCKNCKVLSKRG